MGWRNHSAFAWAAVVVGLAGGCGCDGPSPSQGPAAGGGEAAVRPSTAGPTVQQENMDRERAASWRYVGQVLAAVRPAAKSDADLVLLWPLVADQLDRLPEDDVALDCLYWGQRWTAFLRAAARERAAGPVTDEQRLRVSIEAARLDQEQRRLVSKYQPPPP